MGVINYRQWRDINYKIDRLRTAANHIRTGTYSVRTFSGGWYGYWTVDATPGIIQQILEELLAVRDGLDDDIFELWYAELIKRW